MILTASLLTLAFTGIEILMVHPRLYWGKAGNDLTPALLESSDQRELSARWLGATKALLPERMGVVHRHLSESAE